MKKHILGSFLIMALIAFALVGCFDVPPSLYDPIDPDEENARTPVILSVDKTAMWTDEALTITGQNFSDSLDENFVYFFTVNEPTIGDTTVVNDSTQNTATYNITTYFKDIDVAITANNYVATVTSVIAGVTETAEYREPFSVTEYTTTDSTTLEITMIETEPVFTLIDTTWIDTAGTTTSPFQVDSTWTISDIDTTGYTKMTRTVTTYGSISDWYCHTASMGTVTSASPTQLVVTPPDVDVINAKIAIHVQNAIAPAEWGFIDLMVKP